MSENENVLLWAIWVLDPEYDEGGYWFDGESHVGDTHGVVVYDQDHLDHGSKLANNLLGGEMRPYLTLGQVLQSFQEARAEAIREAGPVQRMVLEQILKLGGL